MNQLSQKTDAERKAIAAKAVATRHQNIREREAQKQSNAEHAARLKLKIPELEAQVLVLESKLAKLNHDDSIISAISEITGDVLFRESQIVAKSMPWSRIVGVYFLIKHEKVVYVGQSNSLFTRISQHDNKDFDHYAFIRCEKSQLDQLESLYIHLLQPELNCDTVNGGKIAPISLHKLLEINHGDSHGRPGTRNR